MAWIGSCQVKQQSGKRDKNTVFSFRWISPIWPCKDKKGVNSKKNYIHIGSQLQSTAKMPYLKLNCGSIKSRSRSGTVLVINPEDFSTYSVTATLAQKSSLEKTSSLNLFLLLLINKFIKLSKNSEIFQKAYRFPVNKETVLRLCWFYCCSCF